MWTLQIRIEQIFRTLNVAHAQWLTYVGRSPPAVCEGTGRGEPIVGVIPGPLARLPSEKAALVRRFRCTEFELRARVAIALNKLDVHGNYAH